MGNSQSNGRPNRLSKPKTNTNSPFGTPKSDAATSPSSRLADSHLKDRQPRLPQLIPLDEARPAPAPTPATSDHGGFGELAARVQARLSNLSRSSSTASHAVVSRTSNSRLSSLPGSKTSLASKANTVDMDTAIKLLHEVRKTASPDDLDSLHQALQPSPSSPCPEPRSRRRGPGTHRSSSLTRRRSLLATPGVATRTSPEPTPKRTWRSWKTPQVDPAEAKKWYRNSMGTTPQTRLAALDLAKDGRESPIPRAKTPGDMDYSSLGSFQLGSLMVTNGAPSPAASTRHADFGRFPFHPTRDEDYFSSSESSATPHWQPRRRLHARSKSDILPPTPPIHRVLRVSNQTDNDSLRSSRCDSPQKAKFDANLQADASTNHTTIPAQAATALAADYMADLPSSPFRASAESAAGLDDEGFSEPSQDEDVAFRAEAFRILNGTLFNEPLRSPQSIPEVTLSPVTETSERERGRSNRPLPRKADSGYSSGGSFRVGNRKAAKAGTVPTLTQTPAKVADVQSGTGPDRNDTASLYTFDQVSAPEHNSLPSTPVNEGLVVPRELQIPDQHRRGLSLSPSLLSPRTTLSSDSNMTTDSTSRRLQKRRHSSQVLPVVQSCQSIAEETIPGIPDSVRASFVRRLSEAPEMECLTRTYLSPEHIAAEELDDNVADFWPVEFPSYSPPRQARPRHHRRSYSERPASSTSSKPLFRRSLSLFRDRSKREKSNKAEYEEDASPTVVDLGTIGVSLGGSPYDIATAMSSCKPVTSPTQPHHLGNAMPRGQAVAGMDARTAAEFARGRSKDLAQSRLDASHRPKSFHERNIEMNEGKAFKHRPHSLYSDAPPLPPLHTIPMSPVQERMPQIRDSVVSSEKPGASFRARSTGRGPMVSHLIAKYDKYGRKIIEGTQHEPTSSFRRVVQRRSSMEGGLREQEGLQRRAASCTRASTAPPEETIVMDRYSGGLSYGYEGRDYGVGGSAGTRYLHSAASRKSYHTSHQYGVDLSDVPIFLQRA